ncbi:MAG: hypothetical protein RRA92_09845 [Gemmatimonadota bacterium]|nr:hypothetical protein [Gemmatimonadota bacterium]
MHPTVSRPEAPRAPLLVLALLAGGACAGGDGARDGRAAGEAGTAPAAVDTVDGVPRLSYGEARAPALGWGFDTLAVIGGFASEGSAQQFDQVHPGGLAGDERDNLYVLDAAGQRVLGFGPGGEALGTWGREGGGPGELAQPGGLAIGPGDSLWVADRANRRVTIYPPDPGGGAGSVALTEDVAGLGGRLVARTDGLYGVAILFTFRPGDEPDLPPLRLLRIERDASGAGRVADTLWTAPAQPFDQVELRSGSSVMMMMMQRTFSPQFWWEPLPDGGFAVTDSADYVIRLLGPDGAERLRIERAPLARAATEADRERARERAREQGETAANPTVRQMTEQRIEKMTFAERIPRVTGLAVDGRGRLWVGVSEERAGESGRIDVYEPATGALLGEIRDPAFFPALFYGDGRAAVLDRDDLDVQRITVVALRDAAG